MLVLVSSLVSFLPGDRCSDRILHVFLQSTLSILLHRYRSNVRYACCLRLGTVPQYRTS